MKRAEEEGESMREGATRKRLHAEKAEDVESVVCEGKEEEDGEGGAGGGGDEMPSSAPSPASFPTPSPVGLTYDIERRLESQELAFEVAHTTRPTPLFYCLKTLLNV
jgi:hypothetical protein